MGSTECSDQFFQQPFMGQTHSFVHSPFIQQIFTEYQLCAKHCERPEEHRHDLKIQAEIKRSEDIRKVGRDSLK